MNKERSIEVGRMLSDFCVANKVSTKDACAAMLIVAGGIVGLYAEDEGALLDGIRLASLDLRDYAVRAWERKRRAVAHD